MPIPGNFLDANTESFETDVSGWTATGGTADRFAGMIAGGAGSYVMRITASGAGNMVATTAARYAVTPGAEYFAYGYCALTNRTSDLTLAIHWEDSLGAPVGAPASFTETRTAVGTIAVLRDTSGTAPAGATHARLVATSSAGAAGDPIYWDAMWLGLAPNRAANMLSYDEYSVEASIAGWTAEGDATVSRVSATHTGAEGEWYLRIVPGTDSVINIVQSRRLPVVAGSWYQVGGSMWTLANSDPNITVTGDMGVRWYDSEGHLISAGDGPDWYTTTAVGQVVGITTNTTTLCPAGASLAEVVVRIRHDGSTEATDYTADSFWFSAIDPVYTMSVSDEGGYVSLTVDQGHLQTERDAVSVYRMHPDGSRHPVRGYGGDWTDQPMPVGDIIVEDYEAPLGIRIWYRVVWTLTGAPEYSWINTRVTDSPKLLDGNYVWLKAPGLPARNATAMMRAAPEFSEESRAVAYAVVGRRNPIVRSATRGGRTGSLELYAWSEDESEAIRGLLADGLPLLLQAMPGWGGLPGNFYFSAGNASCAPLDSAREAGWVWTVEATEIDRPSGGLQGSAGRTWNDIAAHASWDEVATTYATWAEVLTGV